MLQVTRRIFSSDSSQGCQHSNQSWLARICFPALYVRCRDLVRVLIGWLDCLRDFWLARVITLVFILRNSVQYCSILNGWSCFEKSYKEKVQFILNNVTAETQRYFLANLARIHACNIVIITTEDKFFLIELLPVKPTCSLATWQRHSLTLSSFFCFNRSSSTSAAFPYDGFCK